MSSNSSKIKPIIAGLITGIVIAGGAYYFLGRSDTQQESLSKPLTSDTSTKITKTTSPASSPQTDSLNHLNSEKFFQQAIDYSVKNLDSLSPATPPQYQKWQAQFFWFSPSSGDFYIEYSTPDRSIWQKILVRAQPSKQQISYQTIGYFKSGENGYYLKTGQDTLKNQSKLILYQFNPKTKKWERKN